MANQKAHTSFVQDVAIVIATICALSVARMAFGVAVSLAVAVTGLAGCLWFLWWAGSAAQVDRNPEGHDPEEGHGRNDESPVGNADAPNLKGSNRHAQ